MSLLEAHCNAIFIGSMDFQQFQVLRRYLLAYGWVEMSWRSCKRLTLQGSHAGNLCVYVPLVTVARVGELACRSWTIVNYAPRYYLKRLFFGDLFWPYWSRSCPPTTYMQTGEVAPDYINLGVFQSFSQFWRSTYYYIMWLFIYYGNI